MIKQERERPTELKGKEWIKKYNTLYDEMENRMKVLDKQLSEYDLQEQDVLHYIELKKCDAIMGTIYKVDDNIIQGEMNIKYGNGETYNLIIFNNYMGKTTTFNMWRGFSGKCGIENYCINCDNSSVSSYIFDIDKDRVEKVLNSIDKDDTYGIIYKEFRDLALKMIKEDK